MFFNNPKTSKIVDKFFTGDVTFETKHYDDKDTTRYTFKNGIYELTILVFNTWVADMSWQVELKKDGALIPLEDYEFKLFSNRVKEFIRNKF